MTRYLEHVTLTSGHQRQSYRSEVRDDIVDELTALVERMAQGERVAVPRCPGYTMHGAVEGRCAVITISVGMSETSRPEPVPVMTLGVAGHSRCGARLWRDMHDDRYQLATSPDDVVAPPWVADRIEPGMAMAPEAAEWTGDLSRCLAWTVVEMLEDGWRAE